MVFKSSDLELFKQAVAIHNIQPLVREIKSVIGGQSATLYEVIGFDPVTEFIIRHEMEELRNGN